MAKELPYFKFHATEWMTGNIVYQSLEVQGLFINICALYWKNLGVLSEKEIEVRFKKKSLILSLSGRFYSVSDGFVSITFLDEQLIERQKLSETNSKNGSLGGKPKVKRTVSESKRTQSETKANQSNIEGEREVEKEKEIEEEKEQEQEQEGFSSFEILDKYPFEEFWNIYDKKKGPDDCKKKFDKLTEKEKELIWDHVPKYVRSTPEKQYRLNPLTYINGKHWNDEIINNSNNGTGKQTTIGETATDRAYKRASAAFADSKSNQQP